MHVLLERDAPDAHEHAPRVWGEAFAQGRIGGLGVVLDADAVGNVDNLACGDAGALLKHRRQMRRIDGDAADEGRAQPLVEQLLAGVDAAHRANTNGRRQERRGQTQQQIRVIAFRLNDSRTDLARRAHDCHDATEFVHRAPEQVGRVQMYARV